ncbi:MAG: hypothetical protein ABSA33_04540, partial [Candidatus Micrarchaeaceae archaeon]
NLRTQYECLQKGPTIFLHHLTKAAADGENSAGGLSLLNSPYEYLCKTRGSGRLLDFSEVRLAIAEESSQEETFYVLNGIMRSGQVSPIILERNEYTLLFEAHNDKEFVAKTVFLKAPRRLQLFNLLPRQFRFSQAAAIADGDGKRFSRQTVNETLRIAEKNGLLDHGEDGIYQRLYVERQ